jgi:AcrR family transcriptional regulator
VARTRRSAEEARARIVAIARAQVAAAGPSALRLKEVAREAGVSHPTILHHFGSREGLVSAVVKDTMVSLHEELRAELAQQTTLDPAPFVRRLAGVLTEGGFARLLAWMALSDQDEPRSRVDAAPLIEALHRARCEAARSGHEPALDQSTFAAMLTVSAIMGEAIMGDVLRRDLGPKGQISRRVFHERLGKVLELLLERD